MALRDSMRESAAPFLRPDETVQTVFGAQTGDNLLLLGGAILFIIVNNYRVVAVTDQRIVVLDAGKWSMKKGRRVVAELPRSTRFGPASGLWQKVDIGSETLRIHRRFFKDVEAADAAAPIAG